MKSKDVINIFNALSQETRLKIFLFMVKNSEKGVCPCKIAEKLKIPRNTLSFHLALLTRANLCTFVKEGKNLIYKPNCAEIKNVMDYLQKDCISC